MLATIRNIVSTKQGGLLIEIENTRGKTQSVTLTPTDRTAFRDYLASYYPFTTLGQLRGLMLDWKLNEGSFAGVSFVVGYEEAKPKIISVDIHEPEDAHVLGNVVHMETGDYAFFSQANELVLIERKTDTDLLSGMQALTKVVADSDVRDINDQFKRLVEEAAIAILILESSGLVWVRNGLLHSVYRRTRLPWEGRPASYLYNYLLSWQLQGLIVIKTVNLDDTIAYIKSLYEYFQKPKHDAIFKHPRPITSGTNAHAGVNMLMGLDGHGEELSRRILSVFGSLRNYIKAEPKERQKKVSGIGSVRALALDKALDLWYSESKEGG